MIYLIDSNILINSNRHYKQKFFPVVWDFFLNNDVYLIDKVYDELKDKDDELSEWIKNNCKNHVIDSSFSILEYKEVANFLETSGKWKDSAIQSWIGEDWKADPWLISCAKHNSYTIITDEKDTGPDSISKAEPKIPYVAKKLGVKVVNFWTFLENNNFKAK